MKENSELGEMEAELLQFAYKKVSHNICLDHAFKSKESDTLYSAYEAILPLYLGVSGGNNENQD